MQIRLYHANLHKMCDINIHEALDFIALSTPEGSRIEIGVHADPDGDYLVWRRKGDPVWREFPPALCPQISFFAEK